MIVAAAMLGSGLGALSRYGLAGLIERRVIGTRPYGTAAVNILGALLLGLLSGLQAAGRLTPDALTIVGTGFCGGFTTFSTWMVESIALGEEGGGAGLVALGLNLGLVLGMGLLGVAVGLALG